MTSNNFFNRSAHSRSSLAITESDAANHFEYLPIRLLFPNPSRTCSNCLLSIIVLASNKSLSYLKIL